MEGIVFISMNGFTLALYPHDALAEDANVQEDRSNFRGFTLAHNTNSLEEVDEVLIFAKQAGAKIIKPGKKFFGVVTQVILLILMRFLGKLLTIHLLNFSASRKFSSKRVG